MCVLERRKGIGVLHGVCMLGSLSGFISFPRVWEKGSFLSNYLMSWLLPGLYLCPPLIHFPSQFSQASGPLQFGSYCVLLHSKKHSSHFLPPHISQADSPSDKKPSFLPSVIFGVRIPPLSLVPN